MSIQIRILTSEDALAWWNLRSEALAQEPFAFGKSLVEHQATPVQTIAARFANASAERFTLGAFEAGSMVGTMTFAREEGLKERHKGRIYGVYVSPSARRKGVARRLLAELLHQAGSDASLEQVLLAVAACQDAAKALYREAGFRTFGLEPRSLKIGEQYVDEEHMILMLR